MRPDLDIVAAMVPPGARVLDLGCGDGALLEHLLRDRGCDGLGIEISEEGFHACVARGVPVIQADLDAGLADIEDGAFDVVVLSQTLQATHRPALVMAELRRVGRRGVVSFPNFGYWRHRAGLMFRGRMPVSRELPHPWHETPNIHLCTLADFEALAAAEGERVVRRVLLGPGGGRAPRWATLRPNVLAAGVVYLLER
ncbi:MAG TPA: methionine biosynthesis protein MetW [Solirubrobacteraceae bacterium]|nr:methionine biosynthesis protein MetW [Solirubrobacteraceae bacterium]